MAHKDNRFDMTNSTKLIIDSGVGNIVKFTNSIVLIMDSKVCDSLMFIKIGFRTRIILQKNSAIILDYPTSLEKLLEKNLIFLCT